MTLILFLFLVASFLLLGSLWLWLWILVGALKSGNRKRIGILALNFTAPVVVFESLRFSLSGSLLALVFLPWVAVSDVIQAQWFHAFIFPVLSEAITFGFVALLITLAIRQTRRWSIGTGLVTLIVASTIIAEKHSQKKMCAVAKDLGITAFRRNTFFWSLRNTPRDFQFEAHALAEMDGITLGWSYKELSFYEIPEHLSINVEASVYQCKQP